MGIDNNFVALFWDTDMIMRLYLLGGGVNIVQNSRVRDIKKPNLCLYKKKFGDKDLVYSLWYKTVKRLDSGDYILEDPFPQRKIPIQKLCWTDDILVKSQGKTNVRWD